MTPSRVPALRDAASMASQSARLAASGFSTRAWTPASAARITGPACSGCGVQTTTACTRASASMAATSV